ncbi:DUF2905 domain-containing protein [SAR202 cluster bacterium AD-804-J14_MRT_500m]|nr:DUF2905 domain-containing protein [SAR202 cluster bacterium AD-804-J14_MRT_500m]
MQKILILIGLAIVSVGLLYPYIRKLPIGQLPGDVFYQSDGFSFVFPIVTCILISIVLTIIINFVR